MSATTSGALKAFLETQSLGVPVYRDFIPDSTDLPYIGIREAVQLAVDQAGDFGGSAERRGTELVQVDVWQKSRNDDGTNAESYTLVPSMVRALHGAKLVTAPTRVYGCLVDSAPRIPEPPGTNTVHHAITVRLRRVI